MPLPPPQQVEALPVVPEFDAGKQPALGANQLKALDAMVTGSNVVEAARIAGVGRATVFRWMRQNVLFKAALAAAQQRALASTRNKLISLTDMAAEVMRHRLAADDLRAAMAVLKSGGLMEPRGSRKKPFRLSTKTALDVLFPEDNDRSEEIAECARSLGINAGAPKIPRNCYNCGSTEIGKDYICTKCKAMN